MATALRRAIRAGIIAVFLAIGATHADAATFKVLHDFRNQGDGSNPNTALALDYADGFLFGTTSEGGANGFGTAFEVSVYGDFFRTIHAFTPSEGRSRSPVILRNGHLFGTACNASGFGVVYRLGMEGGLQPLYRFASLTTPDNSRTPYRPLGAIDIDRFGNLYGATAAGGANGWGTIYRVNLNAPGTAETLFSFEGQTFETTATPVAGIVYYGGYLYGLTAPVRNQHRLGTTTLFRVPSTGGRMTALSVFQDRISDPSREDGDLIFDKTANGVVGALREGGEHRLGLLFRYTIGARTAEEFDFNQDVIPSVYFPGSGVVAHGGYYYGTTTQGGRSDRGTVYKFRLGHEEEPFAVHQFGGRDGEAPLAGLTIDPHGNIYGVTSHGGRYGYGVVFKIEP